MAIIDQIKEHILNPIIVLLFGVALVVFLYGLFQYLYNGKVGGESRDQAVQTIVWGVAGFVIMLSVFGIMTVIVDTIKALMGSTG